MLHIILGILKIAGILLVALILLLLCIVFAVLFVPVRYKGIVTKTPDKIAAQVRVTWLLRAVSVWLVYDHGQRSRILEIRIFGISPDAIRYFWKRMSKTESGPPESVDLPPESGFADGESKTGQVPEQDAGQELEQESGQELEQESEQESGQELEQKSEQEVEASARTKTGWRNKIQSLCDKIKEMVLSVKAVLDRIKAFWKKAAQIPDKVWHVREKVMRIPEKVSEFQMFLEKYEAKDLLVTVWKDVKRVLKCYAPGRIAGYLKFGTGDPAKTGQILGAMYLLLPARASRFSIQPEFTEKVFETDIHISGHIRVNHMMGLAWRMFRNKKLMRAIKMLRKERRKQNGR